MLVTLVRPAPQSGFADSDRPSEVQPGQTQASAGHTPSSNPSSSPSSNPLDEGLKQLLLEAREFAPGSFERQRRLNRLISQMQASGRIWRGGGLIGPDAYEEALQKTWLYFCRNLHRYDPTRAGVLTWFNDYLRYRIQDLLGEHYDRQGRFCDPAQLGLEDVSQFWENLPAPIPSPPVLEEVMAWLDEERPAMETIHLRNRPDVNCWVVLQRRLPPETPWKVLAEEWQVPIPTLSNFYQQKCLPRLQQFGRDQGYLDPLR